MEDFLSQLNKYRIVLASKSPRRQQLLKQMGFDFEIMIRDTDETYPSHLVKEQIAIYLAEKKSAAFRQEEFDELMLLITADTVVWQQNGILGKPAHREEAYEIIRQLSGAIHEVITGVCLRTSTKSSSFYSTTRVSFRKLEDGEIFYYIDKYKPYDKAGAYGIQEWIGFVGIGNIEGSYYNVMGLPTFELYKALKSFLQD